MSDLEMLARLLRAPEENPLARLARPAAAPVGNTLAQLLMAPPDRIGAMPATPARDVLTMPTPQRGNEVRDAGRNLLAQMAGDIPAGPAANTLMGFIGPAATVGPSTRYVRRSRNPDSPINPRSDASYAMFVETRDPRGMLDQLGHYGPNAWITRGDGAADVRALQPDIVRALRQAGAHEEYGTTAAALAREANPPNIVDSAGLWDNTRLVQEVWDRVLEPRGISSVRTQDGLLLFDPAKARRIRTD